MNREAHLRQSLPSWLSLKWVKELVVVDWNNANPLIDLTTLDPRIRVIRVVEEPRWILSYAYNLGIGRASQEVILKCDADCRPSEATGHCRPSDGSFFAGYWKSGASVGKACVNGQCVVAKSQFEKVNGYSEIIRSYGRDDEDFYDRLIEAGFARQEISPAELDFLPHEDEERMRNQVEEKTAGTIEDFLERNLTYNEMRNFFLGRHMPWGPWFVRASYGQKERGERYQVLRRKREKEIPIPRPLNEAARLFSLRYLIGKLWGLAPTVSEKLEERACLALLVEKVQTSRAQK
jgi:glycosyltransferase involved in cell wall biosynthesis